MPYGVSGGSGTIGSKGKGSLASWEDTKDAVKNKYIPAIKMALRLSDGVGIITPGSVNCFEYPVPSDIGAIYQPASSVDDRIGRQWASLPKATRASPLDGCQSWPINP